MWPGRQGIMPGSGTSNANAVVIECFYNELWNRWDLSVANEIVAENIRFRGSLGSSVEGRESFKSYVEAVRSAFPDWHNRIDEMISCHDKAVTRMSWSGTHLGRLSGIEPADRRVEYVEAAIFRLFERKIQEG